MVIKYSEVYFGLTDWLLVNEPKSTKDITSSIKNYFSDRFKRWTVLPNQNSGEYLLDVMVTNFTPLEILGNVAKEISVCDGQITNYISVESELGGSGGSSAFGVQKNVVEDYVKLLLVNSKYKIMIFTSLPYDGEENHVANRVDNLRVVYEKVCHNEQGVLLVHLPGGKQDSGKVQASIQGITGYIISGDGKTVEKILT